MAGPCLGDDTIAALIEGGLVGAPADRARAHVMTCDACRALVSASMPASMPASEALAATVSADAPGVLAGNYRLERMIGEGGGGRVYVARQLGLERQVAVKVLRSELARDPVALDRFQREARLIASLASDHVVRVHDLGALPSGEPYLVMELLDGEDVGTILARGPVALPVALGWITAAASALGEAHAVGIVHRDVKPSNLFVSRGGRLKVLDFGLAKLASEGSVTATGIIVGSPRYMAPEQITGAKYVGPRADIWALGATLYHLVTGRPPFDGSSIEGVFGAILMAPPPPMDGLPRSLAAVIERAIARDPNARFATMSELAAALQSPAAVDAPAVAVTRRRGLWPVAIASVIVATAMVAFVAGRAGRAGHADRDEAPAAAPAWSSAAAADPAPDPVAPSGTGGRLGNLDEDRLRHRLLDAHWKITSVERQDFPGCHHVRMSVEAGAQGSAQGSAQLTDKPSGDVLLLTCDSQAYAASEAARLRHGFSRSWIETSDTRVLMALLADEHASKAISDQLLKP